jgi:aspartate-semialdehyde dehydrogenase
MLQTLAERGFPIDEIVALASDRSAGREISFGEKTVLKVRKLDGFDFKGFDIGLFSPGAKVSAQYAPIAARAGCVVIDNTSHFRMDPDVPLVVPEVNPDHLDLAQLQRHGGGGSGRGVILTNPNCSTIGLVLALAPLDRAFGVERVHAVTLQAVSGAGFPGVPSLLAIDNVVPFIAGEEAKVESEPRKILGRFTGEAIEPHPLTVSASCTRVPVVDGHTLCVSVELTRPPSLDAVREAWRSFRGAPQELGLPSAPDPPIVVLDGDDAPQPRLHRDLGGGMAVSVGRLRPCPLLDLRFVALSHNTVRGAAGGAILLAELAVARGLVGSAP